MQERLKLDIYLISFDLPRPRTKHKTTFEIKCCFDI